jgi:hypothetical protein
VEKLLTAWRGWLIEQRLLSESVFDISQLQVNGPEIVYAGNQPRYIIFCDGKTSAQNPYFNKLPFALNKGEGMLVEIKGLPAGQSYKMGMSLIPYRKDVFWLGSSYEWSYTDEQPSENFRNSAENWLKSFLKCPYRILEHFSAIRPATLERRPFVGFHPLYRQIGILNGLGTKGCSLSPYFGKQLADQITGQGIIDPLADIIRFEKLLSR